MKATPEKFDILQEKGLLFLSLDLIKYWAGRTPSFSLPWLHSHGFLPIADLVEIACKEGLVSVLRYAHQNKLWLFTERELALPSSSFEPVAHYLLRHADVKVSLLSSSSSCSFSSFSFSSSSSYRSPRMLGSSLAASPSIPILEPLNVAGVLTVAACGSSSPTAACPRWRQLSACSRLTCACPLNPFSSPFSTR